MSGSCTAPVTAAQIDLSLTFSTEAAPWASALSFVTLVDGQEWHHALTYDAASHWGTAKDFLFTTCAADDGGADEGLPEGQHTVTMRASLPGASVTLETAPITVTLSCPPPSQGTGGGGGDGTGGDGTGGVNEGRDVDSGCSVGANGAGSAWAIAGIAAAIAMATRRRKSR